MGRDRQLRWYTLGDIARMVGLSTDTVRRDVVLGELRATRRRRGHYRVAEVDARAYVTGMGCLFGVHVVGFTPQMPQTQQRPQTR